MRGLGFGPTTGLKCLLELDRAQACRGAPIQLAARGERRSLWASFRVAAFVVPGLVGAAVDRARHGARVNYVGGSPGCLGTLAAAAFWR